MSDRKYRQRGYQDEDRPKPTQPRPKSEPVPRELRKPNFPGFRDVVRCVQCGTIVTGPFGEIATCPKCRADLHSCAQCSFFDSGARFECTQPIPARVSPKNARNSCTFYQVRTTVERETGSTGPTDARKAFDDLFK
ncbi:MAG: hypothetical protein HYZ58_18540 [Acidobacteria bacterium]|nr:hypothetical protein [Acidobacteriota bacterium]MBI3265130.1 hypothetical protein [Acidobacteriota bacterium]